jgi:SsrA-binding protein
MKNQINIVNKKAKFEYEFIDTYTCGIVLTGVEVKFIRDGRLSFVDTFCTFFGGELYMRNVSISGTGNDNIKRDRKLLLKKRELIRLEKELIKGLTIVPYRIFINEKGLIKVEIILARGKKLHDKRETIKTRDLEREIKRKS